ncbi:MAG: hypothetical protein JSS14_03410 [Proteobacteria bacterium]|nr:hypothetical protein [Pseudomonadota bacterium]
MNNKSIRVDAAEYQRLRALSGIAYFAVDLLRYADRQAADGHAYKGHEAWDHFRASAGELRGALDAARPRNWQDDLMVALQFIWESQPKALSSECWRIE